MLTIRYARTGKKNKANFKIMLQEQSVAPGGRHVEVLGSYDPHQKVAVLKDERIKYWLEKGAKASDSVHNLLVSKGIVSERKRVVKVPAKKVEEVAASVETPASQDQKEVVTAEKVKTEESKPVEEPVSEGAKPEEVKVEEPKAEAAAE
jgi:small subunit ribosomal protein S16